MFGVERQAVILAALLLAAAVAIGVLGLAELPEPPGDAASSSPPAAATAPATPPSPAAQTQPPATSSRQLSAEEQTFATAFLRLAGTYNDACIELLIANPLAEYDLVGVPLTALVERTAAEIAGLPPLAPVAGPVESLAREVAATAELLRAVDPHGPRVDRATAYQHALDYWIDHVRPVSSEIRDLLGLPPAPSGDLQL